MFEGDYMINFLVNNFNILALFKFSGDCKSYLGTGVVDILNEVFLWVKISVPAICIVLCTLDMAKATIAQDDKGMKVATSKVIKRLIIGVVIFFVPILLDTILVMVGLTSGTCGIS